MAIAAASGTRPRSRAISQPAVAGALGWFRSATDVALGSPVSGIAIHSSRKAANAQPANNANAAENPALSTINPAIELLSAAPSPQDADAAPCARLYRPVPRVRSAMTIKNSAPKIPAPIHSRPWTETRAYGHLVIV